MTNRTRLLLLCLWFVPFLTAPVAAQERNEPPYAPTQTVATTRDQCEENDSLVQPCALPTEVDQGNLNFVDDSIDVFSVLLKANRSYAIRATSTTGIDPTLTIFLAGATETPLAHNDDLAPGSGDSLVQLTTTASAWYLIQVDNQAPGAMQGRSYTLSVRSSAPAEPAPSSPNATQGDAFENNYRVEDAPRLAWDVPYDLSLVCPETRPDACPGGDHDFFLVHTKAGVPLVALTYDLGPGTDTTLSLFRPAPDSSDPATGLAGWQLVQGNDDAVRGQTLRSQLLTTPDWDGTALLIVAASERQDAPRLPEAFGPAGRYRLIVGSPFLPGIQQVLGNQQLATAAAQARSNDASTTSMPVAPTSAAPVVTVLPTSQPLAGDQEEIIRETCLTGTAQVINPDGARFAAAAVPAHNGRYLMVYPHGTLVELLGSCYLGWVKVRPQTAVSPGWMYAPDLALEHAAPSATSTPAAVTSQQLPSESRPADTAMPTTHPIQIQALPSRAQLAPTALPRQALRVSVQVTDQHKQPRTQLRIQLVDVVGGVLREGTTDSSGRLTLAVERAPASIVWVQIPAAGLTIPVDPAKPTLSVVIPGIHDKVTG